MMAYVYILYSPKIDKYYIGSCLNLEERLLEHSGEKYKDSFTQRADDWKLFFCIENIGYKQSRLIEKHIKKMKSRKYLENLRRFEDISLNLLKLYPRDGSDK
jgi:putative endonuclease